MRLPITKPALDGQIFKRQTVIDAAYALTTLGHSGFDRVLLELGMDLSPDRLSLDDRANALAQLVFRSPEIQTPLGQRLDIGVILYAGRLLESASFSRARVLKKVPNFLEQLRREGIDVAAPADTRQDFDSDGNIQGGAGGFNFDTFNGAPFVGPSFGRDASVREDADDSPTAIQSGADAVSNSFNSANLIEITRPLMARLDEIDQALRELRPLTEEIAALRSTTERGIGHNNPPPEQMLTPADLDEAVIATAVAREELQKTGISSPNPIRLSEKVLSRIAALAEWMTGLGKTGVEEYVKAAAQQAGKRSVDVIYYLKVVGILAAAAAGAVAAMRAIPI